MITVQIPGILVSIATVDDTTGQDVKCFLTGMSTDSSSHCMGKKQKYLGAILAQASIGLTCCTKTSFAEPWFAGHIGA